MGARAKTRAKSQTTRMPTGAIFISDDIVLNISLEYADLSLIFVV